MSTILFIHVGDELLDGSINPYSSEMIKQIRQRGCSIACVMIIRDEICEIVSALQFALSLSPDIAVVTGGLGPTIDDVTRDAMAKFLGTELEISDEATIWVNEALVRMHSRAKIDEVGLQMARLPRGSKALKNITGVACGISARVEHTDFFLLPGFPNEFMPMFEQYVLPLVESDDIEELEIKVMKGEGTLEPIFQKIVARFPVRIASIPAIDWRDRGNTIVIKGKSDEVRSAMTFFKGELDKIGSDISCQ
ncbi:MAG: competence/damage-inducible protein A [Euryarchaeota archaeon]|nr:competence/damage-inducible protein A [Euryarchaeota archaeon]